MCSTASSPPLPPFRSLSPSRPQSSAARTTSTHQPTAGNPVSHDRNDWRIVGGVDTTCEPLPDPSAGFEFAFTSLRRPRIIPLTVVEYYYSAVVFFLILPVARRIPWREVHKPRSSRHVADKQPVAIHPTHPRQRASCLAGRRHSWPSDLYCGTRRVRRVGGTAPARTPPALICPTLLLFRLSAWLRGLRLRRPIVLARKPRRPLGSAPYGRLGCSLD
jgi:hypothetical protein